MDSRQARHRACSACKLRKVRCNGQARCQQCEHLNLRCEYLAPSRRRDRQARGRVIEEFQVRPGSSEEHTSALPSLAAAVVNVEGPDYFQNLLRDFEAFVFPFHPVMTIGEARDAIEDRDHSKEAQAFIYALAALTINLTHSLRGTSGRETAQISYWVYRAIEVLPPVLSIKDVSVRRCATVQFIHVSLMGLGQDDTAFFYLRQSTTMIQMLRVDAQEYSLNHDLAERARRQRLYWLVFVHERFYAIGHRHSIMLPPLSRLPERDENIPAAIHEGFAQIVRIFLLVDEDFLSRWFATFDQSLDVEASWIERKHHQIESETAGNDVGMLGLSSIQQADLVITKHWLQMLVWQIAMSKCLLSSAAHQEPTSLLFPVGISSQLRSVLITMSKQAIEVHGTGIQQKLFELTDTIANVVLTVPATSTDETARRIDDFRFLFDFWRSLPRLNPIQLALLESKARKLDDLSP